MFARLHLAAILGEAVRPDPLPWLIFVAGCAGHTLLLVAHINWWYALPIDHRLLSLWRKVHALVVLGGWYLFANLLFVANALDDTPALRMAALAYLGATVVIGVVVFPILSILRWRRRPAPALVEDGGDIVDVAQALGHRPLGTASNRWQALLPFNQSFQVEFSERTLSLPRLPVVWDGLKVLHLSDLHLRGCPDRRFFQFVMDRCREWQPHLVCVTGDIVDSPTHHRWVVPVLGRLRCEYGAFAILGNHDAWYEPELARRRLRRAGYQVLGNAWSELDIRGEKLAVVGNEAPWFRPLPTPCPHADAAFRLCLSHSPDQIRWARGEGIDLMLAGHVHGGQIRFPWFGSMFVPSRYGRRYDCGTFEEPPTVLHVSRGLGGQHPLRYACRPEVTMLTLRPRVAAANSVPLPQRCSA